MLIGILETGRPPEEFEGAYPDYPTAFRQLLCADAPAWRFRSFAVLDNELPEGVNTCDAWLVTGSRFGAYEQIGWITRLEQFLRDAYAAAVPIAGICFGHQLLAQALGGRVLKSDKGWGVGVHAYQLDEMPAWADETPDEFVIQAFHQDQVVELPSDARVLGGSEFCPNGLLVYGDKALSFQGHPEFAADYASALLESRRGTLLPTQVADAALAGVESPLDQGLSARWIVAFIEHAVRVNT
jgi:GMP synthase-like glutamine amidotransferase